MLSKSRKHRLIEIDWPEFGVGPCPPRPPLVELEARLENLRGRMDERKITHMVIYGDRSISRIWLI